MLYTIALLLTVLAPSMSQEGSEGPSSLGRADFVRLRERILPLPTETAWERIPWRPAFGVGLLEAAHEQKPVLLWVMNGHPLGCT